MSRAKRAVVFSLLCCTAVLMTGCSGINYSHGVSPATFLLPGLVEHNETQSEPSVDPEQTASIQAIQRF